VHSSPDNLSVGQSTRLPVVRYDSPTFAGFTVTTAWGNDDIWDAKLNYKGDIGEFALLGQVGYAQNTTEGSTKCSDSDNAGFRADCRWWGAAGTIMHKPTGLYVYGGYAKEQNNSRALVAVAGSAVDDDDTSWYIQTGLEHKWIDLGKTTVFGEYRHDDWGSNPDLRTSGAATTTANFVARSDLDFWAGGVVQSIDAAAMDLYMIYRHVDGDVLAGNANTKIQF